MGDTVDPGSRSDKGGNTKNQPKKKKIKREKKNQQKRKPKIFTTETSFPKGTRDENKRTKTPPDQPNNPPPQIKQTKNQLRARSWSAHCYDTK